MAEPTKDGEIDRWMWWTLAAMTISASMILVDQTAVPLATPHAVNDVGGTIDESQWLLTANILPLAAFMVLGGKLGDLFGLRRVFLIGAVVFGIATLGAATAQSMAWIIGARVLQGCGAALMMPNSVAIVSSTFPRAKSGTALGILAGGSAGFAALGPVLGGVLTSVDWRLVFVVNLLLAVAVTILTLRSTPDIRPDPNADRRIDFAGAGLLAVVLGCFVYGLSQGAVESWTATDVVVTLGASVVLLVVFIVVENRSAAPLIEFRLFRRLNFLAANLSQFMAGMVELGLGYLLPYFLLLVVGVDPAVAGIALIPATIPIILMGPLAGRAFDRFGGRWPLVVGYLVLAASGAALAIAASDASAVSLIPGLVLQGIGLGIILTVNDPTGLTAVDESDQGTAAGMINTSEQLGGAVGIAVLLAVELEVYFNDIYERLADRGIKPTKEQSDTVKDFIYESERVGLENALKEVPRGSPVRSTLDDLIAAHITGFEAAFILTAGIALVGAVLMFALVRKSGRTMEGRVFSRRSRWILSHAGTSPGLTRKPPGTS